MLKRQEGANKPKSLHSLYPRDKQAIFPTLYIILKAHAGSSMNSTRWQKQVGLSIIAFLQIFIKPLHRLVERLFLRPFNDPNARVSAHCEPMCHFRKEVNLVDNADLPKDSFGLLAILDGEDTINLTGSDAERALNSTEFFRSHVGGVCYVGTGDS
jgi:hypothetical protein